ncbi:MAG: glycoside hydrolase family 127 protein [Lentisphaerae bacterium]|nr:glycoside hydrolase family 127 protein [Lentisphaerota bacterium]
MAARLTPAPVGAVRFEGGFLGERMRVNRDAILPILHEQCRATGRLDAWDWRPGQPNPPHVYWDSDVAKWLEAAAYSLSLHPDAALTGRIEALLERMAEAQLPDGYLNSYFIRVAPEQRWTNLRDQHELYCAGHLIEAAVAYAQATGRTAFLDMVRRYADHIATVFGTGPGQRRGYPGHEEIELALLRLFRATGERRYLDLARYFIDERGRAPHYFEREARERGEDPARWGSRGYDIFQAHRPVREQTTPEGHAVRACYLYAAMADLAAETGDDGLRETCRAVWRNLTRRRLYITGGVGSSAHGERFTVDYDLPNETAYAETCASIALMFFAQRMLHLEADGQYADVIEQALYNGLLSGVSLDGTRFFYANPLAVYPKAFGFGMNRFPAERQPWFGCACCPPNLARVLASLGAFAYATSPGTAWVNLYAVGSADLDLGTARLRLTQVTDYPWDGHVAITVQPRQTAAFTLALRLPGWCTDPAISVNGTPVDIASVRRKGYAHLARTWSPGDCVELTLPMPVRRVRAHPSVRHDAGRVALQRGPVLYCLEEDDNGPDLAALSLPRRAAVRVDRRGSPFAGVPVLRARGRRLATAGWDDALYRADEPAPPTPAALTAVPYALWANRRPGEMALWIRES